MNGKDMRNLLDRYMPIVALVFTLVPVTTAAVITYLLVRKTLGPESAAVALALYLVGLAGLLALVFRFYHKAVGLRQGNGWWIGFLRYLSRPSRPGADGKAPRGATKQSKD